MAYSEKVLDHYENPRNVGKMNSSDENVGTGMVGAPLGFRGTVRPCIRWRGVLVDRGRTRARGASRVRRRLP